MRKICHGTAKLCISLQNPGFTGFLAKGLEEPNFDVIVSSGIINLLFSGLTYYMRDILLTARIFPCPFRAQKNTTQLAKYPRVYDIKPSTKMYVSPYKRVNLGKKLYVLSLLYPFLTLFTVDNH